MDNKLPEYISSHLSIPFKWGQHDCVLFAAGWVKLKTGVDYLDGIPKWKTAKQAMRLVEKNGGLNVILDKRFKRINPHMAVDGDLCLYNGGVGIFSGDSAVCTGEDGLVFVDRMEICCAWSI